MKGFSMAGEYSIGFFGDFTTGENYQMRSERLERVNVLRQYGYGYLFEQVECLLKRFDMNILNLETPLTNCVKSSLEHKKTVLHWADGEIVPELLNKYNVEAVSLGNNHGMDYEKRGLVDTFEVLCHKNIYPFGAGLNLSAAQRPYIKQFDFDGARVNLYVFGGYKYRKDYDEDFKFYATDNKEGVFCLTPESAAPLIKAIKENDKNAIIVMFPHFGFDLLKTTDLQRNYARGFIDAGADYVIGHGPHMMNSIEKYKGKTILYGIGNFIFPTNFKGNPLPYNMVAELKFTYSDGNVESALYVYPTYMNNQSSKTQTRPIFAEELDEFVSLLVEGAEDLRDGLQIETVDNLIRIGL